MKICLLTRSHHSGSPRIYDRIAKTLAGAGHDIEVICRVENSTDWQDELKDAIRYIGVPYSKFRKFDVSGTFFLMREAIKIRADVYICFEIRTLVMGWLLKIFQKKLLVYDCHEYWPEKLAELVPTIIKVPVKSLFRSIERFFASQADLVWVVNEHLSERFSGLSRPTVVLPNYPTLKLFGGKHNPPPEIEDALISKKVLIYIGGLTEARGITACLEVTAILKDHYPDIRMLFLGSFGKNYEQEFFRNIDRLHLKENVIFIEKVEHEKIPGYLHLGDLGLFLVQPVEERFSWGEPIKYFEYTAAGLPVVMSDLPAKRKLVEVIGNGILIDPLDYSGTADVIRALLEDKNLRKEMGNKGMSAFHAQYHWEHISKKMISSLDLIHV